MAATIIVTKSNKAEEAKMSKALQFMANNLSLQEIGRLRGNGKK